VRYSSQLGRGSARGRTPAGLAYPTGVEIRQRRAIFPSPRTEPKTGSTVFSPGGSGLVQLGEGIGYDTGRILGSSRPGVENTNRLFRADSCKPLRPPQVFDTQGKTAQNHGARGVIAAGQMSLSYGTSQLDRDGWPLPCWVCHTISLQEIHGSTLRSGQGTSLSLSKVKVWGRENGMMVQHPPSCPGSMWESILYLVKILYTGGPQNQLAKCGKRIARGRRKKGGVLAVTIRPETAAKRELHVD